MQEDELKLAGHLFTKDEITFEVGHKYLNENGRQFKNKYG